MCKFGPNMCSTTLLLMSQSASSFAIDLKKERRQYTSTLTWTTNSSGLVTLTSQCQTPGTRYYRRHWRCAADSTETQAQIIHHGLETMEEEFLCFCVSYRDLAQAGQSHGERRTHEVFEGQIQTLSVKTQRAVQRLLHRAPHQIGHVTRRALTQLLIRQITQIPRDRDSY